MHLFANHWHGSSGAPVLGRAISKCLAKKGDHVHLGRLLHCTFGLGVGFYSDESNRFFRIGKKGKKSINVVLQRRSN